VPHRRAPRVWHCLLARRCPAEIGRTGHAGGRVSSADPLPAFDRVAGSATRRDTRTANSHTGTPVSQGRAFRRCASEPCHTNEHPACGTAYSPAVVRPKLDEQGMPAGESAVRIRCRPSIGLRVLRLAAPPARLTRTPARPLVKAAFFGGVRVSRATQTSAPRVALLTRPPLSGQNWANTACRRASQQCGSAAGLRSGCGFCGSPRHPHG
jgi:hypothetical protein